MQRYCQKFSISLTQRVCIYVVVHCGEAPTVEKATLKVVSKTCGGVASYKCVGERTLFGSPHLLCGPQGKWMGTVPKCVDIPRY